MQTQKELEKMTIPQLKKLVGNVDPSLDDTLQEVLRVRYVHRADKMVEAKEVIHLTDKQLDFIQSHHADDYVREAAAVEIQQRANEVEDTFEWLDWE